MEAVYEDGLATTLDAKIQEVQRASNVEYETVDGRNGWTVRSAKDPELALRVSDGCPCGPSRTGVVLTFQTREEALNEEVRHFWGLIHDTTS